MILLKINYDHLKNLKKLTKENILETISKNTNIDEMNLIKIPHLNNLEFNSALFETSIDSKEKVTNIEELDLFETNLDLKILKKDILKLFEELLCKSTENSELCGFITKEKERILQDYFEENPIIGKKQRLNENILKNANPYHLSYGGDSHGNSSFCHDNQINLLRNRIEILEKTNESLLLELSLKEKYEKDLEGKLAELRSKTNNLFERFEEKKIRLQEKNTKKMKEKNLKFFKSLINTFDFIIENKEWELREIECVKIIIIEKRKDLKQIMKYNNLLMNEEIIDQEIDKSLKILGDFYENTVMRINQISERKVLVVNRKNSEEKLRYDKNCNLCRLF